MLIYYLITGSALAAIIYLAVRLAVRDAIRDALGRKEQGEAE